MEKICKDYLWKQLSHLMKFVKEIWNEISYYKKIWKIKGKNEEFLWFYSLQNCNYFKTIIISLIIPFEISN